MSAGGAAALAALTTVLRQTVIQRMDSLMEQLQAGEITAIPGFRRMHLAAILVNLAQLVLIVWG